MVDGGGLENRCTRKGIGGSNPSPSANFALLVRRFLALAVLSLAVTWPVPTGAQEPVPAPDGPVNDFANILDDAAEARVRVVIEAVERDTTSEIAVATVPSLGGASVEEVATRSFNTWGVGQKSLNNGVLLLVAPNEREVRIEVGYGLEPILPDGLAGDVVRREVLPKFKDGDYPGGISAAVDRLATIIRNKHVVTPEEREELAQAAEDRPPRWLMLPFFGIFLTIGGYAVGSGLKSKEAFSMLFGALFSGIPGLMTLIPFFNAPPRYLGPWFLLMAAWGYKQTKKGDAWTMPPSSKGGSRGGGSWRSGGSSGSGSSWSSGSSGSSGSSSSSFGGGSSGGGGASGRW